MNAANAANWINWHGGKCPVPSLTLVSVRFRTGKGSSGSASARAFRWDHMRLGGDIVAYRVEQEDIDWLKRLRDSSQAELAKLGMP